MSDYAYMFINNLDMVDGLTNSAVGTITHTVYKLLQCQRTKQTEMILENLIVENMMLVKDQQHKICINILMLIVQQVQMIGFIYDKRA